MMARKENNFKVSPHTQFILPCQFCKHRGALEGEEPCASCIWPTRELTGIFTEEQVVELMCQHLDSLGVVIE